MLRDVLFSKHWSWPLDLDLKQKPAAGDIVMNIYPRLR